ncbi:MAG: hypothetical protein G01um10143_210 [Parcubacteria group bacterium Gr01-1014_3]|nr:MAG: hypothetical protein G01um10143_210 [Parcubacteria group bacterium Gr01-1014_3]
MKIEAVVLVSLAIIFAILGIVSLIKMVSARRHKQEEQDDQETPTNTATERKFDGRLVLWFDIPGNHKEFSLGRLERKKGRRAIIRLFNGKRIRRKAYLVYLLNGTPLDVPPMKEPKPTPISRKLEVSSEQDEVTATLLDLERKFESSAA